MKKKVWKLEAGDVIRMGGGWGLSEVMKVCRQDKGFNYQLKVKKQDGNVTELFNIPMQTGYEVVGWVGGNEK